MDTMNDLQHVIVDEHIADLLREGESLRSERKFGSAPSGDDDVGATAARVRHRPARVRLGYWLIGVGAAVAGDRRDDVRGRAA